MKRLLQCRYPKQVSLMALLTRSLMGGFRFNACGGRLYYFFSIRFNMELPLFWWRHGIPVARWRSTSIGLSYIIIDGEWYRYVFINVHCPTEDKEEEAKDLYYETLE
ncbi:hypothetical protein TSAR_001448 [Trichomalopsis sarcophagae]|uniref:Uncharacterized protein n=1 Tax=Trichomalopsis sarcophagae TaxID=543379 RepID=A0A232EET6_9HYME|nr:hypothetical protein TSAR_001448 [Trichomalopsis sarcophagae]